MWAVRLESPNEQPEPRQRTVADRSATLVACAWERSTSPSPTSTGRSTTTSTRSGLQVHGNDGDVARLGTGGEDLLVLTEEPGARPADGYAGPVPLRAARARALRPRRAGSRTPRATASPLTGLSDHAVCEALYLRDPDGHGIEIYADRPREQWEGRVAELMTTVPLDTRRPARAPTTGDRGTAWPPAHDGPRPPAGHRRRGDRRLLPDELGFDVMARSARRPSSSATAATTTTSAPTSGRAAGARQAPDGSRDADRPSRSSGAGRDDEVTDPSGSGLTVRLRSTPVTSRSPRTSTRAATTTGSKCGRAACSSATASAGVRGSWCGRGRAAGRRTRPPRRRCARRAGSSSPFRPSG